MTIGHAADSHAAYTANVAVSQKWCKTDTFVTRPTLHQQEVSYGPSIRAISDLEGHLPVAARFFKCNSLNICAKCHTVLTDTARRAVPRRQLSYLSHFLGL